MTICRLEHDIGPDILRSNISLDKSLHSLLMTTLLPNAHEASRPVEKRNQMSSRLLEVRTNIFVVNLNQT